MIRQKKKETDVEFAKRMTTYEALQQRPGESQEKYYKRLAKQADTRMGRLEELSKKEGYESILSYAYRKAKRDLEIEGLKHFEVKLPKAKDGGVIQEIYNERINILKDFLMEPSSRKAGIEEIYQKKADALNANADLNTQFTWQELADFFESGQSERLFKEYGSKTVMKAIGTIQATKDLPSAIFKNLNLKVAEKEREAALDILRHKSEFVDIGKRGSATRIKLRNMLKKM